MFERLLAALIILALLVLVMFIALPYTPGSDRPNSNSGNTTTRVEPGVPPPSESAKVKPPVEKETTVAKNEPAPQAPETIAPPPPEKPSAEPQKAQVPNPPANGADSEGKAPVPTPKQERDNAGGDAPPKQKFVKSYLDRLPISPAAEPPPKASPTVRYDRPIEAKRNVNNSKGDRLNSQTPSRTTAQRPTQRVLFKGDRERDDDIGEYIRRGGEAPPAWNRTHYYECAGGRCECSCERPYWARSGSPCWD
jgi:hypothetical protein